MAYEAFILLPSDSPVSIEEVRRTLEKNYTDDDRDVKLTVEDNGLTVKIEDWQCFVDLNAEPYVLEESQDFADNYAKDRPDKDEIAASGKRLEISSDDDDDMDYFNDYLEITQTLGAFKGAKTWEGAQEEFID